MRSPRGWEDGGMPDRSSSVHGDRACLPPGIVNIACAIGGVDGLPASAASVWWRWYSRQVDHCRRLALGRCSFSLPCGPVPRAAL